MTLPAAEGGGAHGHMIVDTCNLWLAPARASSSVESNTVAPQQPSDSTKTRSPPAQRRQRGVELLGLLQPLAGRAGDVDALRPGQVHQVQLAHLSAQGSNGTGAVWFKRRFGPCRVRGGVGSFWRALSHALRSPHPMHTHPDALLRGHGRGAALAGRPRRRAPHQRVCRACCEGEGV